jgi:hypothetical protein
MSVGRILAVLLLAVNCNRSKGTAPASSTRTTGLQLDRECACKVARADRELDERHAVRCAEEYVQRNGYLDTAPSGRVCRSGTISGEPRNLLEATPLAVCSSSKNFAVMFRTKSNPHVGVAVEMGRDFSRMYTVDARIDIDAMRTERYCVELGEMPLPAKPDQ